MSRESKAQIVGIFEQLRLLRESVLALQSTEEAQVVSLRGQQTVDAEGAICLSFLKLQEQIASMEETLAAIAEATGELLRPK